MSAKHSPAPWTWNKHYCGLVASNGDPVLQFYEYEGMLLAGFDKYEKANARLIAAAPELLEALNLCLAQLEPSMTTLEFEAADAARAAISKATQP